MAFNGWLDHRNQGNRRVLYAMIHCIMVSLGQNQWPPPSLLLTGALILGRAIRGNLRASGGDGITYAIK